MKNITLKLKHLVLVSMLAMFATSASAVTYSLTTHVDGRTETATVNLAAGAELLTNMPQKLWRAYCEYTFYSDAEMTQEITEVPADAETVYVDYVFDPPFILSEDDGEPVWHLLKHDPSTGQRNVYYSQYHGQLYQKYGNDDIFYAQNNLSTGSQTLKTKKNAHWAFYGDAYCLNLKFNDVNNIEANDFMVCKITASTFFGRTTYTYKLVTGPKMMPGWQMYVNDDMSGSFSLGLPEETHINQFVYYYDGAAVAGIAALSREGASRSAQNHITGKTAKTYAFMAVPADGDPNSTDPWRVTYKIQKIDGTWYDDIIQQKTATTLTPSFPPGDFTPSEDYAYDYFYMDAEFAEKCADDYVMPAGCNTVLYLREVNFVSTPWMTLVLPYDIEDLDAHFGDGAVMVNEYSSVTAEMTEAGGETYFNCHLNFSDVQQIEAYKPYLFKALRVNPVLLDEMYYTVEDMQEPIEVKLYDDANAANIGVSMKGVLTEGGYEMPGDGLNFFFGSVKNAEDDYSYNFYRRGATIPQFRCYFFVTDERTGAETPIKVRFGSDSLTGISTMTADTNVNAPIYSLDGRKLNSFDTLQKGIYIVNGRKIVK